MNALAVVKVVAEPHNWLHHGTCKSCYFESLELTIEAPKSQNCMNLRQRCRPREDGAWSLL